MRPLVHRAFLAALTLASLSALPHSGLAQMHKVAKPEQVVRAIGVYEWTGDFAKPTASRLIPVSLYIEGQFQDAGIYIARPVPFALLSGNVYELQDAGIGKAFLDLAYARHFQTTEATGDLAYDDGWFGYGSIKPIAAPRRAAALKPSKTLPALTSSKPQSASDTSTASTTTDPDRPTMKRRSPNSSTDSSTGSSTTTPSSGTSSTTSASNAPADDPDRPTMKRRDGSTTDGSTTSTASSTTPADDPDRPTMTRRTSDPTSSGTTTASTDDPANDPDRPTLKRRSPEEAKKSHTESASVSGASGSLNDDPDRPSLHHGKPTQAMTETDLPKLMGLPSNIHQMVAVSDAVTRDPHPYTLAWDDATQRAAILQKMQALARAQLAAYGKPASATPAPAVKKTTSTQSRHTPTKTPPPPLILLADEELKAYTLSYGGDPTYIYSAHTAGTGAALRYVTIVAQANGLGDLKPAIQNVTDAAHLDVTPRMSFVDVVDAEASNRASLLFELRTQNARQFGLYRVIAAHSEQIFLTGTTQ